MVEIMVDAIENGKIVRVNESYAKAEGLLILRKQKQNSAQLQTQTTNLLRKEKEESLFGIDTFRRSLKPQNQVESELIDNFHWHISTARRKRNMTRKHLAEAINEPENNIKLIENGILPSNDFILINKIQSYLKINLRKDGKDFINSPRSLIKEENKEEIEIIE